jgi:hypothetical protein
VTKQSKTRDELINVRINEVYKTPTISNNNLKFIISNKLLLKQSDSVKLISICSNILEDTDFMDEMKKSLKDN